MTIDVDLTGIEAWTGGVVLPPGEHLIEVTAASEGTSSGGHPQVELEMKAIAGEHVGSTIRDWLVATPQSLGKLKMVLVAFGASEETLDRRVSFEADTLVGKRCRIVVRNEPSPTDGKERARVKAYEPAGALPAGAAAPGAMAAAASDDTGLPFA